MNSSPPPPVVTVSEAAFEVLYGRYREVLSGLGRIPDDASPLHRVTASGLALSADLAPVPAGEVVPLYVREPDAEVRRDLNPWSKA